MAVSSHMDSITKPEVFLHDGSWCVPRNGYFRGNRTAKWLDRLAQDQQILVPIPGYAEHPL